MMSPRNAALLSENALKLGLFGANCSGGRTYATIPETWVASWENNLRLAQLGDELGFELRITDVDAVAAAGDSALRAEFGDRLPVVLLDGAEHSYWEVDEPRLRADLIRG